MKLSLAQLQAAVAQYVTEAKISNATYQITRDNVAALVDKIAKIFTLDTRFVDKLAIFDGEEFSYGKDIEEWQEDLILPVDYDATGSGNMAPNDPTYRPNFYSKSLGKKVFITTQRNNNLERAVHFQEQLVALVSMISKRLYDSEAAWRYEVKRELVGAHCNLAEQVMATGTAFSNTQNYGEGSYLKGTGTEVGIVVKAYSNGNASSWADAVAKGFIIPLDLVTNIAIPTDTATGEAFLKQVKADIEIASDISEGHSLNGNTLGVTDTLVLLVKQGVMPSLDVDTMAGAFHLDKVAIPVEIIVVKDFGSAADDVYAVLTDSRAFRLHNTYRAVREDYNGKGDFINYNLHTENTGFASRNTFFKVYKNA